MKGGLSAHSLHSAPIPIPPLAGPPRDNRSWEAPLDIAPVGSMTHFGRPWATPGKAVRRIGYPPPRRPLNTPADYDVNGAV